MNVLYIVLYPYVVSYG